jgi:succinate dehydrogenase/fumarate reductase-like Fe-S protein
MMSIKEMSCYKIPIEKQPMIINFIPVVKQTLDPNLHKRKTCLGSLKFHNSQ